MAKKVGQVQGVYGTSTNTNFYSTIKRYYPDVKRIVKLGIQLERDYGLIINSKERFYMGKTGTLEYDNVDLDDISRITVFHIKDWESNKRPGDLENRIFPIIIDFVYEDE